MTAAQSFDAQGCRCKAIFIFFLVPKIVNHKLPVSHPFMTWKKISFYFHLGLFIAPCNLGAMDEDNTFNTTARSAELSIPHWNFCYVFFLLILHCVYWIFYIPPRFDTLLVILKIKISSINHFLIPGNCVSNQGLHSGFYICPTFKLYFFPLSSGG